MNIYAKKGTKIIGLFENNVIIGGYELDKKNASEHIKEGEIYTVNYTDVGSWHTDVFLEEIQGRCFNSVHFADIDSEEGRKEIAKNRLK